MTQIKKIDSNTYEVEGAVSLNDINDAIDLDLQSENYNSIGGYIIEKLEALPETGSHLETEKIKIGIIRKKMILKIIKIIFRIKKHFNLITQSMKMKIPAEKIKKQFKNLKLVKLFVRCVELKFWMLQVH